MTLPKQLVRLSVLRSRKEARARTEVIAAAGRLQESSHNVSRVKAAIDDHNLRMALLEKTFLEGMLQPLSGSEIIHRIADLQTAASEIQPLQNALYEANLENAECQKQLCEARCQWQRRRQDHNRLSELLSQLRSAAIRRQSESFEIEIEEEAGFGGRSRI